MCWTLPVSYFSPERALTCSIWNLEELNCIRKRSCWRSFAKIWLKSKNVRINMLYPVLKYQIISMSDSMLIFPSKMKNQIICTSSPILHVCKLFFYHKDMGLKLTWNIHKNIEYKLVNLRVFYAEASAHFDSQRNSSGKRSNEDD